MQVINTYLTADTFLAGYYVNHPAWSSYDAESGFNYTRFQHSSYIGGGVVYQGALNDDGDSVSFYVNLAAGTYQLDILHVTFNNFAIVEMFLGGVSLGTSDWYSAGTVANVLATVSGVSVAENGNYEFKLQANGKNASSTDYTVEPQWFSFTRTAA